MGDFHYSHHQHHSIHWCTIHCSPIPSHLILCRPILHCPIHCCISWQSILHHRMIHQVSHCCMIQYHIHQTHERSAGGLWSVSYAEQVCLHTQRERAAQEVRVRSVSYVQSRFAHTLRVREQRKRSGSEQEIARARGHLHTQ